jgi:cytochrome b6-f complex iron-sulfur subunit
MGEQRNAGRRVISQADAQAIAAKAGVQRPNAAAARQKDPAAARREFLAYAMAASGALLTVGSLVFVTAPDPAADPMLGPLLGFTAQTNQQTGETNYPVAGGFAYPRIKAGTFGGRFTVDKKAADFKDDDPPLLVPDGKFYLVKVKPEDSPDIANPNEANLIAIYQVCTHLGCLIPYIQSEKRFICPCHGSTFERNSQYVRGPAPRNLDQFPVEIVNGVVRVNTGLRKSGEIHA